jgi:hypothetical protein
MNIGVSVFLITLGAILAFAVHASVSGLDIQVVGGILMVVGILWLVLTLVLLYSRRTRVARGTGLVEERRVYDDRPTVYDEPPMP